MANKILVLASTGTVGHNLIQELAATGEQVLAGTRDPHKLESTPNVTPVRFDYTDESTFDQVLEGTDRVFLLTPTGVLASYELLLPFLQRAVSDGKRKIVLMTALGVEVSEEIPYRKLELFVERSGVPFVFLRPNWFMDNFQSYWLAQINQTNQVSVPAGDSRTAFIDARDIAAVAASVLRTNRFDNQAFTLNGPESLTYAEAASLISQAAGREIRYVPADDASFVQQMIEAGLPSDYANFLATLFVPVRMGAAAPVTDVIQRITGGAPRTLAQHIEDYSYVWKTRVVSSSSR